MKASRLSQFIQRYFRKQWRIVLTLLLLTVAAYDTWIDELTVIAATFIGLAALPWLIELFDRITLPGGVEIDFAKAKRVLDEKNIDASNDANEKLQFLPDDPNLVLVALRIEIEKNLRRKYSSGMDEKGSRYLNIYRVIEDLAKSGVIDWEIASMIKDMLPAMNSAAHGQDVDESARQWVQQNGPRILAALGV